MLTSHEDEHCCCHKHLAAIASLAFVEPSPNGSEDTTIYEYVGDRLYKKKNNPHLPGHLSIYMWEKSWFNHIHNFV
jgi:hypothetical protein